jgi:uncharacterized protein
MHAFIALAWGFLATFLHNFLMSIVLTIHANAARSLVPGFLTQAIAYGATLFIIVRVHAPTTPLRDLLATRSTHWGFIPLAIVVGVVANAPADAIYVVWSEHFPTQAPSEAITAIASASRATQIVNGLILIVLGPLVEEMFFRGAIFRPLLQRYPIGMYLPLTALSFAFAHVLPHTYVPIFLMGLILGYLRASSGSLLVPFVMHAAFNGVGFVFLVSTKSSLIEISNTMLAVATTLLGMGLIGVSMLARTERARIARGLDT